MEALAYAVARMPATYAACAAVFARLAEVVPDFRPTSLLDVGAGHANYESDMTRTIPVNGRFTRRQRQVYEAVLRVFRRSSQSLRPGKLIKDWQREAEQLIERELVD